MSFEPTHALGRAQTQQSQGRHAEAGRLVADTFRDDRALRGLCFEHFTVGGAEIVMSVCAPDPWLEADVEERQWLDRLDAMSQVVFVERNLVAQAEGPAPS